MNKEQRAKQLYDNAMVEYVINRYNNDDTKHDGKFRQLYSCRAWYADMGNWIVLKSYNTIVALFSKETECVYDFLRYVYGYTATSAKHIAKFRNLYVYRKTYTWREIK